MLLESLRKRTNRLVKLAVHFQTTENSASTKVPKVIEKKFDLTTNKNATRFTLFCYIFQSW